MSISLVYISKEYSKGNLSGIVSKVAVLQGDKLLNYAY